MWRRSRAWRLHGVKNDNAKVEGVKSTVRIVEGIIVRKREFKSEKDERVKMTGARTGALSRKATIGRKREGGLEME